MNLDNNNNDEVNLKTDESENKSKIENIKQELKNINEEKIKLLENLDSYKYYFDCLKFIEEEGRNFSLNKLDSIIILK